MGVFPRMLGVEVVFTGHLIMFGEGTRGGGGGWFLGATSLLALLHRIFLADEFVFVFPSFHSGLHRYITMNETIVLNT